MKVLDKSNLQPSEDIPVVNATLIASRKAESPRAEVVPVRRQISNVEAASNLFLRQFRVLLGAARLYQRNHPRLMEILASTEQQLRIALAARSPLVFGVERDGIVLPPEEGHATELLHDSRGELAALAEELLRSGIYSMMFNHPIRVGELDLLAHEMSQVPRSGAPGDTELRKMWENWIKAKGVIGIRINIPTERRDSLLLASLISAVLAHEDAPKPSARQRGSRSLPDASLEQVAATLRVLAKLALPRDPEMRPSAEEAARRFHSLLAGVDHDSIALLVRAVSQMMPREGETLEPYLERLADVLVLAYVKHEFEGERITPPGVMPLLIRLDQERTEAGKNRNNRFGGFQHDEARVSLLCEKFWNSLPARAIARTLRSRDAWAVPAAVVARFLEPFALAVEKKKKADAAAREGRALMMSYARCLESEEGKVRRAVAAGLGEVAPQSERLWPHASAADFSLGIVRALLLENSPGIGGLLSAAVENLARIALRKHQYLEFERILEALEAAPRDDEHAHFSTLAGRMLNDEQWLYLVDEALGNEALNPAIPRLLRRSPDRLIDRLGLLLTGPNGANSLPPMVRLIHGAGEPVLGALESRLYEARKQPVATAIQLLASADPKRLAGALPRALAGWEWSLQDLAVTELLKWTNPPVAAAAAKAFHATLAEAHSMVVPCMIDHLGLARETAAVPALLQIAAGDHAILRDIYLRIKAIEALGRMRVPEAAAALLRIVRERNGLAHNEPAALRSAAEEALGLLENRPSSARARMAESARVKTGIAHSRPRRYLRARLENPLPAVVTAGSRSGAARVRVLALGGAFLETALHFVAGDSLRLEIKFGFRKMHFTAIVRNVMTTGVGVEFVHMNAQDRERLRRLVSQSLK